MLGSMPGEVPSDEVLQRFFNEWATERFGSDWRRVPADELKRALRDDADYTVGDIARLDQSTAFEREAHEFAEEFIERLEPYGAPVSGETWAAVLVEVVEERYGGVTTHAVEICAALGFEIGRSPE